MKRKSGRPIRSLAFLPPGLGIAVALAVAALAFLLPQGIGKAEAYSVTDDGRIMVNASQVQVSLHWYEAEFNNVFGMDSPVPQDFFGCKTQPADVPIDIGTFGAGELVFRLKTPEGNTWLTGPASRNVDNFQHAQLEAMSDTVIRIHWEDYYGGGDQDFNDCVVDVSIQELPTATSTPTVVPTATLTDTPTATPTETLTDTPVSVPTGTYTPPPTSTPTATPTEAERSHERRHTATPVAVATMSVGNTPAAASARAVLPAETTRQLPPPAPAQSLPSSGIGGEHETIWATIAGVLSSLLGAGFVLGGLRLRRPSR